VDDEHPLVLGHEASGIVASTGPAVTSVKTGDYVAIEPGFPCRRCRACKGGFYNLCPQMNFAAAPPDCHGTLTKFFVAPEDFVYKVPDAVSLQEAVLVEPLSVAIHATRLVDVKPGQDVLVIGSGTIGLLCAAVAKAFGAHRVTVVDILERKLEFASSYLSCETFLSDITKTPEEISSALLKSLDSAGVDAVIEASGAESSIQAGIYALKRGGHYVQTGIGKAKLEVPMLALSEKELMIRGCFRYGSGDYDLALKLLSNGTVRLKPLITSITAFGQAKVAWEKTARGEGIKNLIQGVQN
jgi:D-xylulose reductase